LPSFIQSQIEAQPAFMQFIHNRWPFHKNNLMTREGKAASEIRPDRARAKGEHFHIAVEMIGCFR
jgi:hypothetical protein